jgi:serine/threonine protein kinase
VKCENCCRNKAANCWFCWYCRRPWKGSLSSRRCGHERCSEGGEPLHIQEEISRGAYGVVYRGDKNGRTVAAKAVHETLVNIAKSKKYKLKCLVEKFKAEAFLLQSIDHPHIVRCYCLEERGKELYLVMERMRESLFDVIERGDRKKCFSSSSVGKQVASALDYLHSRDPKVIHRDLSSKNVLIGSRNEVKVGDFGMAKCRPRDLDYLQTKSPGSFPYMPPEALNNDPKYTEKLDVFSLGVVILEVETLQHPESNVYGIGYEQEVVRRKKHLDKVSSSNPIKAIIVSCLENDHHKRPTSRQIKERLDKL